MDNQGDSIRRDALARDLARRQALANLDELRVVDVILLFLECRRDQRGALDLEEQHWERVVGDSVLALGRLGDDRFEMITDGCREDAFRHGWNAGLNHAMRRATDTLVAGACGQLKQTDRDRAALYEAVAAERLERVGRCVDRDIKPDNAPAPTDHLELGGEG